MILYKDINPKNKKIRPGRTLNLTLEERPQRVFRINPQGKDRVQFIKKIERECRNSPEYKEYMRFFKVHMDMDRCTVLKGLDKSHGQKYTIEIHHEPFTLFDICATVLCKFEDLGEPLNPLRIADEVMELHYAKKVGLVPLSKTMHELVGNNKIFLPLQYIYQRYDQFYEEYAIWIQEKMPRLEEKIREKVARSLLSSSIQSDILDPEFVYVSIDGFDLPVAPPEWETLFSNEAIAAPNPPPIIPTDEERPVPIPEGGLSE